MLRLHPCHRHWTWMRLFSFSTSVCRLNSNANRSFSFSRCCSKASNSQFLRATLPRSAESKSNNSNSRFQFLWNSTVTHSDSVLCSSSQSPTTNSFSTMSALEVREIKLPPSNSSIHDDEGVHITPELQEAIDACSTCLLNGRVISVPTDTIYGIAGLSQNIDAVNRIYDIKQRNYQNPVAISVGHADDIYRWSKVTVPRELLTDLLPGPVTVVFERSPELNPSLNPHTSKVGIRIPGNTFMQELAKKCAGPIALTSANISGGRSCLQIEEFQHLWPQLDLVVNGGALNDTEESRLGSTVVDLSEPGTFRIIRNGSAHVQTMKVLQDKYNLKNASSDPPQAQR